jgi:hypothetical protein
MQPEVYHAALGKAELAARRILQSAARLARTVARCLGLRRLEMVACLAGPFW